MQSRPPRPTGVTVLGVLQILGGIIGLAAGAIFLAAAALIGSSSFASSYPGLSGYNTGLLSAVLYGIGGLALILGILALVIGIGFFGGKGWSWTLAIIVGVINIAITIVELVIGLSGPTAVVSIIIPLIIIYYLMRPHVKAFFGKGPAMSPGMMPGQPMGSYPTGAMGPMGTAPSPMNQPMGQTGMTCKNCGASIPAGATRCPSCGASL